MPPLNDPSSKTQPLTPLIMRNILDAMNEVVIVLDASWRVNIVNRAFSELFQLTPADVSGRFLFDLEQGAWNIPELLSLLGHLRTEGSTFSTMQIQHEFPSAGKRLIHVRVQLISEDGDNQYIILMDDYTEQVKREKERDRQISVLNIERMATFAGGVAHDINNALGPVLMAAEMLRQKTTDEAMAKKLSHIEGGTRRIATIIKQLLACVRETEGERIPLKIEDLLEDTDRIIREGKLRSVDIKIDTPPHLWTISGDRTQLKLVIQHLTENARDAMPQGGRLVISAENKWLEEEMTASIDAGYPEGCYVLLKVSDTGKGIPPDVLEKIFDPFFTTKIRSQGTGLGLSTVLSIVKSHGGFITVDTKEGEGATFNVYFPAKDADDTLLIGVETMPAVEKAEIGGCILVVDDEPLVLEMTVDLLEAYDFEVVSALDGAEGLGKYVQDPEKIDLVLSDLEMPVMDGRSMILAMKRINPKVKVIAMTGFSELQKDPEASGLQDVVFLNKPFESAKLIQTIHEVLNQ